jgi:Cu+-exporting ATPase
MSEHFCRHDDSSIRKVFQFSYHNVLIGIGIAAAIALSIWNLSHGIAHYYFDSAVMIAVLVTVGPWVESILHKRANQHMRSLVELLPQTVRKLQGDQEVEIAPRDLRVGDRFRVLVGERVAADARLFNAGSFDESILTGEAKPLDYREGNEIAQGALNVGQPVELEVIRLSENSVYEQLVQSVQKTLAQRSPLQKKIDSFAKIFVPIVVVIACVTAFAWRKYAPQSDLWIVASLSVLVIACPCAIGIATPMALFAGVLNAGRRGILIKSLDAIEKASEIKQVAFDKTGTLTLGQPSVQRLKNIENVSHRELLQIAAAVEGQSEHPYAKAIQRKAKEEKIDSLPARNITIASGKGVGGFVQRGGKEVQVFVGNLVWLFENHFDSTKVPADLLWDAEGTHETVLWVGVDQKILGLIFLSDTVREGAREVIREIQDKDYLAGMITGDAENVAKYFAKELNLKFYHAGVLPEEKATIVKRLSEPKKKGMDMISEEVAFVGDGVNDAPALAAAKLGIAMGSGSALSQTTADVVLLSNDLRQIPAVFSALKQTRNLITQNLLLSFGYNIVAIPIAAGVLYPRFGILLSPTIAAISMAASSVTVLLNSLRALRPLRR